MKHFVLGIILALQFLTRIPIPINCPWEKQFIKGALQSFGIIGFIIGGILSLVYTITDPVFPLWMSSLFIITLWVILTGGLHLDGLMDVADAIGSNAPYGKKLEIMKDPQVGSFAVLTVIFHLVWKVALFYVIVLQFNVQFEQLFVGLSLIAACSRLIPLFLLYFVPVMKQEGLAYYWKQHLSIREVIIGTVVVILFTLISPSMLLICFSYFVYFFFFRIWIMKNFKGINGDILGASIEGGELWGLFILWMYTLFVMG
ncbi:adenosylcobinamide-GDP ribazoletransferase [uncultured Metabacillus sp.]|uniref:adenosylcobinamide-GDP ribazoletransferase n=1 Tax=uncultured Metabacillus sp. TaxID=2860135 RepID=UPI00262502E5|nr:adenosylcobinamide-GDP ribazoletransferase [uncultured Metabacillus sp.]